MTQPLPNVQPSPRAPKAALIALIAKLSGVQTLWRTDKVPAIPGMGPGLEHARIFLRVTSYGSIGTDELRQRYNAVTNANDNVLVGQRQFTLSVRAESLDANLEAYDLCERVRFRLRTEVARGIFSPAFLSLRDVQPIAPFEQRVDSRTMRVATMDIRWNLVVFEDPLDPGEGNWIQTVDGGGPIPGRAM